MPPLNLDRALLRVYIYGLTPKESHALLKLDSSWLGFMVTGLGVTAGGGGWTAL
jgi:hypothetical protein